MNKRKYNFDGKSSASIILGVFVCFFMIAVYTITTQLNTSYALPLDDIDASKIDKVTSTVTTITDPVYVPTEGKSGNTYLWHPIVSKFQGQTTIDEKQYLIDMFCLEVLKDMPNTTEYKKLSDSSQYIDEGIAYIINTAYKSAKETTADGKTTITVTNDEYYDAQLAIWIYQELKGATKTTNEEDKAVIEEINKTWTAINANHASGNAKIIYDYVIGAQEAQKSTVKNSITVSSGNPELKLSEDKSYYITDLLTVSVTTAANTTFEGLRFTMNNKDYNTTLVDESGKEITDYTTLKDTKFRVKVAASDLQAGSKISLTGNFSGVFTHSSFLAYSSGSNEDQIALLANNTKEEKVFELQLNIKVEDTKADYSQYIYMIGAMVLVIGLAVIYVNTKQEQN